MARWSCGNDVEEPQETSDESDWSLTPSQEFDPSTSQQPSEPLQEPGPSSPQVSGPSTSSLPSTTSEMEEYWRMVQELHVSLNLSQSGFDIFYRQMLTFIIAQGKPDIMLITTMRDKMDLLSDAISLQAKGDAADTIDTIDTIVVYDDHEE
ncbi:hypothetical protein BGZ99_002527 [Dissophora globulifera]|uniref:Uncharacterized protein n=1 Tax=Dissophora globulifera TaxID=979702 RepID=A0A9P6UHY8_9FUNG|nr:hypothetical protein BGZ99_002527 [Dissophora globulifera]